MNSVWYTVYEGGELKPGYEVGRIRVVLRGNSHDFGRQQYVPIALFFRRDETIPWTSRTGSLNVDYLLSETLRELLMETPKGGPYQAVISSPPYDEGDYAE